jgi:hypothetical protein
MSTPIEEDPRFERLPKWVKDGLRDRGEQIVRLEQELARARALLNEGPEDASVVIDPYSENRQPQQGNPTVEFRFKQEHEKFWTYFLVRLTENHRLDIHASSSVTIHPSSGNAVNVEVVGR